MSETTAMQRAIKREEVTRRSVSVLLSARVTENSNTRHHVRIRVDRPGSSDGFDLESSDLRGVRLTGDDLELIEGLCREARAMRDEALYAAAEHPEAGGTPHA